MSAFNEESENKMRNKSNTRLFEKNREQRLKNAISSDYFQYLPETIKIEGSK